MKRIAALFVALNMFVLLTAEGGPITFGQQATKTASCTGSTGATALSTLGADQLRQVELSNAGTVTIFVEFGDSSVQAVVASGYPILAGQTKVVTVKPTTTHVACITGGTAATLYATVGIGE